MIEWVKKFVRWLLNKDELDAIHRELVGIKRLLIAEMERRNQEIVIASRPASERKPLKPIEPVQRQR